MKGMLATMQFGICVLSANKNVKSVSMRVVLMGVKLDLLRYGRNTRVFDKRC
jgi:hypothetical protein